VTLAAVSRAAGQPLGVARSTTERAEHPGYRRLWASERGLRQAVPEYSRTRQFEL